MYEELKDFDLDDFYFYVVHLSDRTDRYNLIIEQFQKLNISLDKVVFVEGHNPTEYEDHNFSTFGRYCATRGHLNAIKKTVEDGCKKCFILENDCVFKKDFRENITSMIRSAVNNNEEFDGIFFRRPRRGLKQSNIKDDYIVGKTRFVTVECYFLTYDIRKKIVNDPDWFLNGRVIDVWYSLNIQSIKSLDNYTEQNNTKSSMGSKKRIEKRAKKRKSMDQNEIIQNIRKKFVGVEKWKFCKDFKGLRSDEYRIFDIYDNIDYVIDVGSCLGEISYACRNLFPSAKIVAVEPCIDTYRDLVKNLDGTGVHTINAGMWHTDDIDLKIFESPVNIGSNKTAVGNDSDMHCKSKTIQTLFHEHDIDQTKNIFLKIDCEGAEMFIVDDISLCQSVYQLSIELHAKKRSTQRKETFKKFVNCMLETHDLISGKFKETKNCTLVFRRKGSLRRVTNRCELVNHMISYHGFTNYLEVGVGYGDCYKNVNCENKLGVDLYPKFTDGVIITDSDSFFADCDETYDLIFIDGDHSHEQSLKDIINAFDHLRNGGYIVCHDCFPKNEKSQYVGNRTYNGQVWMAFKNFTTKVGCKCHVLDMDHGCGIMFKNGESNTTFEESYMKYEWEEFAEFKKSISITPSEFMKQNKAH